MKAGNPTLSSRIRTSASLPSVDLILVMPGFLTYSLPGKSILISLIPPLEFFDSVTYLNVLTPAVLYLSFSGFSAT